MGALGELLVGLAAIGARAPVVEIPGSILVVRNNDLGDVLVATPIFEALKRRFPAARVVAGVGDWACPILDGNPFVDEIVPVNAPWWNKYSAASVMAPLRYLLRSAEVRALRHARFDVGIDFLGSRWGALLLLAAGIPKRLGVAGFAGGHWGMTRTVKFSPQEHVAAQGLRLAAALGAVELPEPRPQVYLTPEERARGEAAWGPGRPRILVAPGGGHDGKCWPRERFEDLALMLGERISARLVVVTGPREREWIVARAARFGPGAILVEPPLRELFALVAASDLVVCNSSVTLHAAAAFRRPALCLLGASFASTAAHDAQWGYPGLSRSLGREGGRFLEIATVEEALWGALSLIRGGAM